MSTNVGIIGIGKMGLPVALSLLEHGFTVYGYRGVNSIQICGTKLDTAFVPPLSMQLAQRSFHIPSSEWIR
jgi:6-phosphogluconate dehydrogenase (decarboxylating)